MAISYERQLRIFNPDEHKDSRVTVIGLGNIGSNTAVLLARLGIKNLSLYDFDTVDNHNLTSQYYDIDSLGKPKANVLADKIEKINPDIKVSGCNWIFEAPHFDTEAITIIAIDTMEERKKICNDLIKMKTKLVHPLIDGRVGGTQLEVYTANSLEEWQSTFVSKPSKDPCGGRFICYVSTMVASIITSQVKKILNRERYDKSMMVNADSLQVVKEFSWK